MQRSLGGAVRRVALRLLTLALLAVLTYGGWAWFNLNRRLTALGPGGRAVGYELAAPAECPVKTSWPYVVRANVKHEGAQNWLPAGGAGLVEKRFCWSPGEWKWVEDPPAPLLAEERLNLELLARLPPPSLIEALEDPDPHRREVAGRALRIETGQDFGYRFDAAPERRSAAAAAFRKWWETNKLRYGKEKLEKLEKVLKGAEGPAR